MDDAQATKGLATIPLSKFFGENGITEYLSRASGSSGKTTMEV